MPTLAVARQSVLEQLHAIVPKMAGARVTTGTGSTTTAQINALGDYPDNSFIDTHWLILPGGYNGTSALEVGRVSAFDQDNGSGLSIVTVLEPFAGTVASGVTAYLSPAHPDEIRTALNSAGPRLFPHLAVPRRYHHVNQSHVFNGFFDFWNGSLPQWWARSDTDVAVTRDKISYFGESSMKLVSADEAEQYIKSEPVNHNLLNALIGESLTLHMYGWCDSASSLGIRITDGDGQGTTVWHTGASVWEKISTAARTIVASTPSNPIQWEIVIAAGATGYASVVWTTGGPAQEFVPIPPQFRRGPSNVRESLAAWPTFSRETDGREFSLEQAYPTYDSAGNITTGRMIRMQTPSASNGLLYIEGEDYLSAASVEADVYEVEAPQDALLYVQAIVNYKRGAGQDAGSGAGDFQLALARDWDAELKELTANPANSATHPAVSLKPMFGGPGGHYTGGRFSVR